MRVEQEVISDIMNSANNVALVLYDIYTTDALENYLGFWRAPLDDEPEEESGEEEDDWESDEDDDSSCS